MVGILTDLVLVVAAVLAGAYLGAWLALRPAKRRLPFGVMSDYEREAERSAQLIVVDQTTADALAEARRVRRNGGAQ